MILLIFDILIIAICIIIIRNFKLGYFLSLIIKIAIPSVVRFQLGGFSINHVDILMLALLISFIIKKPYKRIKLPKKIKAFILINVLSTLVLIIFSLGIVPYEYQLSSYFKGYFFQTYMYIFFGYFAFQNIKNIESINKSIIIVSIVCGIYGIITYITKDNPYINILYNIYSGGDNIFSYFMEETRGGIEGRISGTMSHPLHWGQYWNIVIAYLILFYKRTNIYLLISICVIGVINIVLCGSRTSLITLVVTFIFFISSFGFKSLIKYSIISYVILVFTIGFIPQNNQSKGIITYLQSAIFFWDNSYSEKANIQGSNTNMRLTQLNESIKYMKKNPIGGVGYNYQYYVQEKRINTKLMGFESIVFKLLVEQGIISLILFFYTYNLLRKHLIYKRSLKEKILLNGYFASFLISILFTGIQANSWIFFICFSFIYLGLNKVIPKQRINTVVNNKTLIRQSTYEDRNSNISQSI